MVRTVSLVLLLCSLPARAVDMKGFAPTTLSAFETRFPTEPSSDRLVSPVPGFSIRAQTTGDFRKLAPETRAFLTQYEGKYDYTLRTSNLPTLYSEELLISDGAGGRQRWLAVPTSLSKKLHEEAKIGTSFLFLLRYLGAHGDSRIYLLVDFHSVKKSQQKTVTEATPAPGPKGHRSADRDPASAAKPPSARGVLLDHLRRSQGQPSPHPTQKSKPPSP